MHRVKNTMDSRYDIPCVGGQNTIDREVGLHTMGRGSQCHG